MRMKLFVMFAVIALASCGGGDGPAKIEGPLLSTNEIHSMAVDEYYVNGGLDDEYSGEGEFSVYLRDAATGIDVACATQDDGMKRLAVPAVYYGGLSVPLVEVDDDHPNALARFQAVFVEQDSEGCPKPIDSADDVVGMSDEFTFEGLLGKPIWASNGRAVVEFRHISDSILSIQAMAPSLAERLELDELYFDNGEEGDSEGRYYIFADVVEGGESVYQCQIEDSLMEEIKFGKVVYSALGFPIGCFDANTQGFADLTVRLGLYIQRTDGPALVGETEPAPIGELIGEKVNFTNGAGFVLFRGVETVPFDAPVLRLDELDSLKVSALSYALTASLTPTLELHAADAVKGYSIACAGAPQGLTGIGSPGNYSGLSAPLVAVDGQKELFGWETVKIRLIDRSDGLSCPSPIDGEMTILGESADIGPSDLGAVFVAFENGAGSATFEIQ